MQEKALLAWPRHSGLPKDRGARSAVAIAWQHPLTAFAAELPLTELGSLRLQAASQRHSLDGRFA